MNWKSIVSIIALLATGFMAGFFTNRYLTVKAMQEIAVLRKAEGMEKKLYKILQLKPVQKAQLGPIIKKHFTDLATMNQEYQQRRAEKVEQLKAALIPKLTEAQQEKLETFTNRLKKAIKRKKEEKIKGGKKDHS